MNAETKKALVDYMSAVQVALHAIMMDSWVTEPSWHGRLEAAGERLIKQLERDDTYEKASTCPIATPASAPAAVS